MNKPSLGVMPQKIWIEMRINDLLRAISERRTQTINEPPIIEWSEELVELLKVESIKFYNKKV